MDGKASIESVPTAFATWFSFTMIWSTGRKSPIKAHELVTRAIGLDASSAELLKWHVEGAVRREAEFQQARSPEWCQRLESASREVSASHFSGVLEAMDSETEKFRESEIARLSSVLDEASLAKFNRWVQTELRPRIKGEFIDHARSVAEPDFDRKAAVSRICPSHGK